MKRLVRTLFYSNSLFRWGVNFVSGLLHPERRNATQHLLSYRGCDAIGPLQGEEALFLFGLIKVTKPRTVLEFGFGWGHSAFNLLQALPSDSHLYSFDIDEVSAGIAKDALRKFKNFRFVAKSQDAFRHADVEYRTLEFVFLDGAHEIEINKRTFHALLPYLSPSAIIAVHDTGTWAKEWFQTSHAAFAECRPEGWINEQEFQHQPDERIFVNWITSSYPDFQAIHLHCTSCLRHGLTLIQRRLDLTTASKGSG